MSFREYTASARRSRIGAGMSWYLLFIRTLRRSGIRSYDHVVQCAINDALKLGSASQPITCVAQPIC